MFQSYNTDKLVKYIRFLLIVSEPQQAISITSYCTANIGRRQADIILEP
jgi:hypothetical protein